MVVGPEKLPALAQSFARFIARARSWVDGAKARVKEEMGDEFDDVEWRKLDPRQYDPRRIIREALLEDATPPASGSPTALPAARTAPAGHTASLEPGAPELGAPQPVADPNLPSITPDEPAEPATPAA